MRQLTEKRIFFITLAIILAFSIFINLNSNYHQVNSKGNLKSDKEQKIKKTGFWDIGPIEIDDDDPTKNWLITEATYNWCSGSGSLNDPYRIENVTIDGTGTSFECILIQNSNAYFVIKNCTIYNAYFHGILLISTNNGKLIENDCSNNGQYGIKLIESDNNYILNNIANNHQLTSVSDMSGIYIGSGSDNNEIKGNIVNNNDIGIKLHSGDININYNVIQNNTANNNRVDGIRVYASYKDSGCNYNKLLENIVNNNEGNGIYLYARAWTPSYAGSCNYNEIWKNTAKNNGYHGISLHHDYGTGSCSVNDITENIVYNNTQNGISLVGWTVNNKILHNNITDNYLYGALIEVNSDDNTIYNNTFIGNTVNALDSGTGNQWDYGSLGNYWDDYAGVDANDDGIGDSAYDVPPAGGSVDNYPIWDDGDDLAPDIIIKAPSMNDAFGLIAPNFTITINDASPINTTLYTIDGGITNYTFSGYAGTINQTAWDNKGTEQMTLRFYANDSLGHLGFKDVIIWKDLVAPKITINSPTPNQLCGVEAPTFSLTIVESNIQIKRYSINGRPNITFTTETQLSQTEWDNIGNGTVSITFYIIDKAGNTNSSTVIVRKDINIPEITILSPIPDEMFGNNPPDFNISISEDDLVVSTWYTIQGSITQYPITGLTGTIDQDAWNDALEGDITITFYAQDRAGNIGTESVTVIKSIPTPPAIPGYNLLILCSIFFTTLITLIRKKNKS